MSLSGLGIRARMALAYAGVMLALIIAGGLAVYLYVAAQLDESISTTLEGRAAELSGFVASADGGLGGGYVLLLAEEGFSQVIVADGELESLSLDDGIGPVLTDAELERARSAPITLERTIEGVEGTTRMLAQAASSGASFRQAAKPPVVVVGASTADRREALRRRATPAAGGHRRGPPARRDAQRDARPDRGRVGTGAGLHRRGQPRAADPARQPPGRAGAG